MRDWKDLELAGAGAQAWPVAARFLSMEPSALAQALAPAYGVEPAGRLQGAKPEVLAAVPFNLCQRHALLPLRWQDGALVIATADPSDDEVAERIRFLVGKPLRWVLAPPLALEDAILAAYAQEAARESDGDAYDENAIVKLGRALILQAVSQRASDLHLQPHLGAAMVRVRVDGQMRRLRMLPDAVAGMLIRHFKARGGMDPSNTRVPQDGRMSMVLDDRDCDMRLSALPTSRGERFVIRFLFQGQVHRLGMAGFSHAALQTLRRAIARPAGMIVFTGPTGSGKTSTLYGMLSEINRSDVNIITVENPVEYRVPGISQVEVNEKAGRTFAASLRSILRQDPDVVLIGEIRDRETAEIAVQAAMTGHLVLTTLHTNDAMTTIPRLLDLGVQPSVLADALAMVASQRLCRVLCAKCKGPVAEPLAPEEKAFREVTHNAPAFRAMGCAACDFTGYRGRLPIVDIVEVGKPLRDAISAGESHLSKLEALREGGLQSLAASGSFRVISGDTTVREVADVVGPGFWPELARHYGTYFAGEVLDSIPLNAAQGFGVLLVSSDGSVAAALEEALAGEGFRLVPARSPDEAERKLHEDEDIAFILGDVPDGLDFAAVAEGLRLFRQHTAWARLPGAVLLQPEHGGREAELRASGMMAAMFTKPLDVPSLIAQIRRAQAR